MAKLNGIDHIHIYVSDRAKAVEWFEEVLGFRVVKSLLEWADDGGPLTVADTSDQIHLALFERDQFLPTTAVAFGADAENFIEWKQLLESKGILARCSDHQLAWSLYFHDPFENMYEITTYEHSAVALKLSG